MMRIYRFRTQKTLDVILIFMQVEMSWSSKRKQPGSNVTMTLKSGPGAVCGYSVVDRSVTYARPDLQLTESNIYSRLPGLHIQAGSRPSQVTPDWEHCASNKSNLFSYA